MKLYSGPLSLFSAKARMAVLEKGLDHELVQVGWSPKTAYAPHHPDVVALNPKGQVPVLVDGDVVVSDSTLIFEYLEDRAPEPPLYPRDAGARTRCRQQEAAADEIWFPHVWTLIEARVYRLAGREAAVDAAVRSLEALYGGFDRGLDGREYWCGAFSAADIATFVMTSAAGSLGAPIPAQFERMVAWRSRVVARPAVRTVSDDMNAFAARSLAA